MRIERWYWLLVFCLVSLAVHGVVVARSRTFRLPVPPPKAAEVEVTLTPPEAPPPPPKPEAKPPTPPEPPKPAPEPLRPRPNTRPTPASPRPTQMAALPPYVPPPSALRPVPAPDPRPTAPAAVPGGADPLKDERPLPLGVPTGRRGVDPPRMERTARADVPAPVTGGGGSPAPGPVLGGKGGAPGPEAPPEDILYTGGGAGGTNLPRTAPRIGGGGGRSVLSVENPLAREAAPDERPGLGPGRGGGQGAGAGGGVGFGRGRGIGTRLDGTAALATLRSKPGPGIGAGSGSAIGTRPPGGGSGTGSEQPGTGGAGLGYGRGRGIGIGAGSGPGVGGRGGGDDRRAVLDRGVPFGDITGMLRHGSPDGGGGSGGGPGGPGRGSTFTTSGGGRGGRVHIIYLLDSSGSMRDGNKIGKAKEELKKALSQLKRTDTFNLIHFDKDVHVFSQVMIPATPENVQQASGYVDAIQLRDFTNMSGALEQALAFEKVTHIFLLSDGEPHGGIEDPTQLRQMVRDKNRQGVRIITLALGLGEMFKGIPLLRGLADDNNGQFSYVNLSK